MQNLFDRVMMSICQDKLVTIFKNITKTSSILFALLFLVKYGLYVCNILQIFLIFFKWEFISSVRCEDVEDIKTNMTVQFHIVSVLLTIENFK